MILGVVTYVLVVARTGNPVPTALGVPYGYASAVTRVLGRTIAMSALCDTSPLPRASTILHTIVVCIGVAAATLSLFGLVSPSAAAVLFSIVAYISVADSALVFLGLPIRHTRPGSPSAVCVPRHLGRSGFTHPFSGGASIIAALIPITAVVVQL